MEELEIKTQRLISMLNAGKFGGVLLNSQHNFAWLTGGRSNGVDSSRENGACSILIRDDGKRFLIANRIEMPRILAEELSERDFIPIEFEWEADKKNGRFVLEKAESLLDGKELVADVFFDSGYRAIEGLIARCRYQLTAEETISFKKLGMDASNVLVGIPNKIKLGQTEKEIANVVKFELGKLDINAVVTLVAADERVKRFRHPIPTSNVWEKVLLIVICAKRQGLIASLSRIYCSGEIPSELAKKTDAVARVHAEMMSATQPGRTGAEIFAQTKKTYHEVGFTGEEQNHHQGGACGYKTRDWVAHSNSNDLVLLNQAFAWNPSIAGTKSEETFIVTENGIEIITSNPNFPVISNVVGGKEYLTPGILVI